MKQRESPIPLSVIRVRILRLAAYQQELYAAVRAYADAHGGIAPLAHAIDHQWIAVARFLNDRRPLYRGTVLDPLARLVGKKELPPLIRRDANGIGDRWCGLSLFPESALELVFDLHAAHQQTAGRIPVQQFARFFHPRETLVEGIMASNTRAIQEVFESSGTADFLRLALQKTDWPTVSPVEAGLVDAKLLEQLRASYDQFLTRYPTKQARKEALHMDERTIVGALEGRATRKTMQKLIDKIQTILGSFLAGGNPKPEPSKQEVKPEASSAPDSRKLIRWFVSNMNSAGNLLELIDPAAVLDGDRTQIMRSLVLICRRFGITPETLARLGSAEPINENDKNALTALRALSGRK